MCFLYPWRNRAKYAKFIVIVNFWFSISKLSKKSVFFVAFLRGRVAFVLSCGWLVGRSCFRAPCVARLLAWLCCAWWRFVSRFPFNIVFKAFTAFFRLCRVSVRGVLFSRRGGFVLRFRCCYCFSVRSRSRAYALRVRPSCVYACAVYVCAYVCAPVRPCARYACAPAPTPPVCAREKWYGGVTPPFHFQKFFIAQKTVKKN